MSTPNIYIPADNPLISFSTKRPVGFDNRALVQFRDESLKYGTLPPNYEVKQGERRTGTERGQPLRYLETIGGTKSWNHPLSPDGLKERKPKINPEFDDDREDIPGLYQPPMVPYRAGHLVFKEHDTWQAALAESLHDAGVRYKTQRLTEDQIENVGKKLKEDNKLHQDLYHPADRGTIVFQDEPECAAVAAQLRRSLVIVCPLLPDSEVGWDRPWNYTNRPPIRYRWSTGPQANYRMTFLACFPTRKSEYSRDVIWASVKPSLPNKNIWDHQPTNKNMTILLGWFEFPTNIPSPEEKLAYTMVLAHRSCLRGPVPKAADFGQWIKQYGLYIERVINKNEQSVFSYNRDVTKDYKGRRIGFIELGAWLLSSNATLKYVQMWEDADDADMKYRLDRTDANWEAYKTKTEAARRLP